MTRSISAEQAAVVVQIVTEECGYRESFQGEMARAIQWPHPSERHPCQEYRFMGALGYGGKFRNNGNRDNTPYVDCYRENESPETLGTIDRANARLADLFQRT